MHHVKFVAIHQNFTIMLSSLISANYFAIIYAADNSQLMLCHEERSSPLALCHNITSVTFAYTYINLGHNLISVILVTVLLFLVTPTLYVQSFFLTQLYLPTIFISFCNNLQKRWPFDKLIGCVRSVILLLITLSLQNKDKHIYSTATACVYTSQEGNCNIQLLLKTWCV